MSSIELYQAYEKNPILADQRYRGRRLRVKGAGDLSRDADGGNSFRFNVISRPAQPGDERRIFGVFAFIDQADERGFAREIGPYDRVEIEGVCRGFARRKDGANGAAVLLDHCRLVGITPFKAAPGR